MKSSFIIVSCLVVALSLSCAKSDNQPAKAPPSSNPPKVEVTTPAPTPAAPTPAPTPVVVTPPAAPDAVPAKLGLLAVPVLAGAAPKVDGVLDDAAWAKAASTTAFKTSEGLDPTVKTRLLVTQDKDTLYVAVECTEKGGTGRLVANATRHDEDGIWEDDDVELFIDPTNKRRSYYQIIVNSKGATWDVYHPEINAADPSWEPKYQSAVRVGKESWIVEFALPLSVFNRTATSTDTWAFNVLRMAQATPETIYFSPTAGTAHHPAKFGTLTGIKTTWKDRAVEPNKPVPAGG